MSEINIGAPVHDNNPLILGEDPITRIRKLFHFDDNTGEFSIQTQQRLDPILEDNALVRNADSGNWRGDTHHVGRIPSAVWYALPEEIRKDHKALIAWLNKSENKMFRTKGGTL